MQGPLVVREEHLDWSTNRANCSTALLYAASSSFAMRHIVAVADIRDGITATKWISGIWNLIVFYVAPMRTTRVVIREFCAELAGFQWDGMYSSARDESPPVVDFLWTAASWAAANIIRPFQPRKHLNSLLPTPLLLLPALCVALPNEMDRCQRPSGDGAQEIASNPPEKLVLDLGDEVDFILGLGTGHGCWLLVAGAAWQLLWGCC
ncbi:hypothetical protein K470DRAFT_19932 [Piedraia hortae CBS 480.64]|uniref:Uncharacterized protein n=1 Tax=Piedraia hortae CBS 480.64 TaxID=1314780 RepID=A0A6A7BQW7_9PEZI|nr:hypothetical protein K470DRAFT_19932 [Piedraia hortae CBS 480.64]